MRRHTRRIAVADYGNGVAGLESAEAVLEIDELHDGFTHSICPETHNVAFCCNGKFDTCLINKTT